MNGIKNFVEAKKAVKELRELANGIEAFILSMEQRIDAIRDLKGEPQQPDLLAFPATSSELPKAPETWNERVLEIFRSTKSPQSLRQKDVVEIYKHFEWPKDFAHSLYQTISGSIAYLHRKGDLVRTSGGYQLKPK